MSVFCIFVDERIQSLWDDSAENLVIFTVTQII